MRDYHFSFTTNDTQPMCRQIIWATNYIAAHSYFRAIFGYDSVIFDVDF